MTDTTSSEVEKAKPADLVTRYKASFGNLLPSHMREDGGDQWVATVRSLLLTRPEIAEAASNGPGEFMAALVQAAQKGLVPGTNEFHLVPFAARKGQPRKIQGIEGYQGIIERIYRAGAVSSVIVEVVRANDTFTYQPGDGRPEHVVDWFGDRGALIGAYAYAVMRDGATSKVVIIGKAEAELARSKSASARSDYSPWNTNEAAMWAKTAARRLENWVPTSAEYRRQQLRDAQAVQAERDAANSAQQLDGPPIPASVLKAAHDEDEELIDPETGEVLTSAQQTEDVVDAVLVEDVAEPDQAPPASDGEAGKATNTEAGAPEPGVSDAAPAPATRGPIPTRLVGLIRGECARLGVQANADEKRRALSAIVGRPLTGDAALFGMNRAEVEGALDVLQGFADRDALVEFLTGAEELPEG